MHQTGEKVTQRLQPPINLNDQTITINDPLLNRSEQKTDKKEVIFRAPLFQVTVSLTLTREGQMRRLTSPKRNQAVGGFLFEELLEGSCNQTLKAKLYSPIYNLKLEALELQPPSKFAFRITVGYVFPPYFTKNRIYSPVT